MRFPRDYKMAAGCTTDGRMRNGIKVSGIDEIGVGLGEPSLSYNAKHNLIV